MKHPLLNPESNKHYNSSDKTCIEEMEEIFTVDEMISYCKVNIFKYEFRKDIKGQKESDLKKIETYKNYLKFLEIFKEDLPMPPSFPCTKVYWMLNLKMEYTL